jgi:hypothetical protein
MKQTNMETTIKELVITFVNFNAFTFTTTISLLFFKSVSSATYK